ncbi:SGNH/GDSL hydrolase family protein [bacterium]|nr:SGNH/GDSL hydrolase family protein [bacterium]
MTAHSREKTGLSRGRLSTILFVLPAGVLLSCLSFVSTRCDRITSPINHPITGERWTGTWAASPQLVEPGNMPPAPGLANNTLRQIVCVSIGGERLRVRFSNEFSTSPVTLDSVHFTVAAAAASSAIDTSTGLLLAFNGSRSVTLAPDSLVNSDPFDFDLQPRALIAITIHFGSTSSDVTGHPGSRTTSYLVAGNQVDAPEFNRPKMTDHWYVISGIDVAGEAPAGAVVCLGNSITDGRGSGTNRQNRWPDELMKRLLADPETENVSVLNEALGGNCILKFCIGPGALSRFERDVLKQHGVRWLIILEGVNDIGNAQNAADADSIAGNLIAAYERMIDRAHTEDIRVYGATILPFQGHSYYTDARDAARMRVNDWIRTGGRFDAVIDFDAAMRDPLNPRRLLPAVDGGDHLHPNEHGYQVMAGAVDLTLFR